jgi:SAM-dependent methyltransferase
MTNFFSLFWTRLVISKRNFVEYIKVLYHYYPNSLFAKADLKLLFSKNPFSLSKSYLQGKGADDLYTYGETPLSTLDTIAKTCEISDFDTVLELGCGRGRTCFFLNLVYGCSVIGVDVVPAFIDKAQGIVDDLHLKRISFKNEDMLEADFSKASVVYLYGTCLEDAYIKKLALKLSKLPSNTKIITVSFPLSDYSEEFELLKRFEATFTWGVADVYLQVPRC